MTDKDLFEQALNEIQNPSSFDWPLSVKRNKLIHNLTRRLEQPEKLWQGLTDSEFHLLMDGLHTQEDCWFVLEYKLKERNT